MQPQSIRSFPPLTADKAVDAVNDGAILTSIACLLTQDPTETGDAYLALLRQQLELTMQVAIAEDRHYHQGPIL